MAPLVRFAAAAALGLAATLAPAQPQAPLMFEGRWKAPNSSNTISLRIDSLAADGRFEGSPSVHRYKSKR